MKKYHMDITILNICRLPENSNLLQQLCISQFQLRPDCLTKLLKENLWFYYDR